VDPDSGRSTTTYDLAGQVASTTDALSQVLSYEYDELGRKIASWKGGTKLASWVYDTALNGARKLHSSSIRHGQPRDFRRDSQIEEALRNGVKHSTPTPQSPYGDFQVHCYKFSER
jgi:YD repeat-containing protein